MQLPPILLAYSLGNLWRRLALLRRVENWSLMSLQQRLVKTGGRMVGVAIAADGSVLVSDDARKLIWCMPYGP